MRDGGDLLAKLVYTLNLRKMSGSNCMLTVQFVVSDLL
jgi:hypothetical protein